MVYLNIVMLVKPFIFKILSSMDTTWVVIVSSFVSAAIVMPSASGASAQEPMLKALPRVQAAIDMKPSSQESATIADSAEARAQNVRQQIVELASAQFGPSLLNDWNHPKATYPTQADTYVMAFTRLMALEISGQRIDE